jgi:hypothetical protein
MAILRCKSCNFLREVPNEHIGKTIKCPKCSQPASIFDATILIQALFKNLVQIQTELKRIKQQNQDLIVSQEKIKEIEKSTLEIQKKEKQVQHQLEQLKKNNSQLKSENGNLKQQVNSFAQKYELLQKDFDKIKLENNKLKEQLSFKTNNHLNQKQQGYAFSNKTFAPELLNFDGVVKYFSNKKSKVEFKEKQMDISGFFDEIAVEIGDNYQLVNLLIKKIKNAYRNNAANTTFVITDLTTEQLEKIKLFCKILYECAFIIRFNITKKAIHLELQVNIKIMNFFNGEWLEWYAFMKTASLLTSKKIAFSSLKNFIFNFENGDKHEADLFFVLPKNKPLWIECKSGEFRQDINKYTKICKALNIPKENFLLLVLDESDEKMIGLSNTFDITFVSEKNFLNYIEKLL